MNPPEGPAAPASGDTDVPTFAELAADPEIAPLLDFEPVPVQPRINGWDADAQKAFIALLAITGSRRLAADAIGRKASSIERILKRDDADALRAAHDGALALFRRNHGQMLAHSVAAAKSSPRMSPSPLAGEGWGEGVPGQVINEHGEWEDEAAYRRRVEEAVDSIGAKLVRCRRAFLAEISGSPGKRAAFEILTELPVDWDLAARLEPQPFEPWTPTNQRQPDMVLTAESGWQSGIVPYGPDRKAELIRQIQAYRAEHGMPEIEWDSEAE